MGGRCEEGGWGSYSLGSLPVQRQKVSSFLFPSTEAYCSSQSGWLFLSLCLLVGAPSPHLLGPADGIVWLLLPFVKGIHRDIGKLEWIYYMRLVHPSCHIPFTIKKCLHEEAPAALKGSVVAVPEAGHDGAVWYNGIGFLTSMGKIGCWHGRGQVVTCKNQW